MFHTKNCGENGQRLITNECLQNILEIRWKNEVTHIHNGFLHSGKNILQKLCSIFIMAIREAL